MASVEREWVSTMAPAGKETWKLAALPGEGGWWGGGGLGAELERIFVRQLTLGLGFRAFGV